MNVLELQVMACVSGQPCAPAVKMAVTVPTTNVVKPVAVHDA